MRALLSLFCVLTACGGPAIYAGDKCDSSAKAQCNGAGTALFCEGGRWVQFQCGKGDCTNDKAGEIVCSLNGLNDGVSCPALLAAGTPPAGWCENTATKSVAHICTLTTDGTAALASQSCAQGCTFTTSSNLVAINGHCK